MRWNHGENPAPPEELEADWKKARKLGKLRLGERWVFLPKFSGVSYLAYPEIAGAWLRQEEVNAKVCCGRANFDRFFVVLQGTDGEARRAEVPGKAQGQESLSLISQRNPAVQIGYKPAQATS